MQASRVFLAFLAPLACLAGCSDAGTSSRVGEATQTEPCPGGVARNEAGACVVPSQCTAGTASFVGEEGCQPIGWQDCDDGFELDSSGWGCREIAPETACTGATRDALGSVTCVPIGDCNAPFPPPSARLFVSPTGPINSTHFRRIDDAASASRSGDVIAIEDGVYNESVQIDRPVTLVGRCAAKVILEGNRLLNPGLIVDAEATLRGLTVRHFSVGLQATASFVAEDVLFDSNTEAGLYIESPRIDAKLTRSVVRDTRAGRELGGMGVDVVAGRLAVSESAITANRVAGVFAGRDGIIDVTRSIIRDTTQSEAGQSGYGVDLIDGEVHVTSSVIRDNTHVGVRSLRGSATVERSVIRGTRTARSIKYGVGIAAVDGGTVAIKNVLVTETHGVGLVSSGGTMTVSKSVSRGQRPSDIAELGDGAYVFNGGTMSLAHTALVDNRRAGIDAFDVNTKLSLDHVLVGETRSMDDGGNGLGIIIALGAHATIASGVVRNNHHTGIYVDRGTLDLSDTSIADTSIQEGKEPLGHGLLVMESPHAVVARCDVRRSQAGGIVFSDSNAIVSSTLVAKNKVGVHVQGSSTLQEAATAPAKPIEGVVLVTTDTRFEDNEVKVGNGIVPLPDPFAKP